MIRVVFFISSPMALFYADAGQLCWVAEFSCLRPMRVGCVTNLRHFSGGGRGSRVGP